MADYTVVYPICGTVEVFVEADSKEEAIEKGWDLTDHKDSVLSWDAVTQIVQGNIFYGASNNIEVYED